MTNGEKVTFLSSLGHGLEKSRNQTVFFNHSYKVTINNKTTLPEPILCAVEILVCVCEDIISRSLIKYYTNVV